MTTFVYPNDRTALALGVNPGDVVRNAAGQTAIVYTDAGKTTLAPISTLGGVPIVGSVLTVDIAAGLGQWQNTTGQILYVSVAGGPAYPVGPTNPSVDLSGMRGTANGVASLDGTTKVPIAQLPSLPASQVGSGTFDPARLPDLSGTYASAAALSTYQAQTPTIEELVTSVVLVGYPTGATVSGQATGFMVTMFIAPFALQILGVRMSWDYWTLAASDTAYWSFSPTLIPASGGANTTLGTLTTKTTPSGGGGPIAPRKSVQIPNMLPTAFAAGDLLAVVHTAAGGVGVLQFTETITLRYQPL